MGKKRSLMKVAELVTFVEEYLTLKYPLLVVTNLICTEAFHHGNPNP